MPKSLVLIQRLFLGTAALPLADLQIRLSMNYATQPASGYGMAFLASSWPIVLSAHFKLTRAPF
jgi:hypothetical protein